MDGLDKYLTLDKFTIPFYFGSASDGFKVALGYIWSNTNGVAKGYLP